MEKNVLIVGASGFAGFYLWKRLVSLGIGERLYGTYYSTPNRYKWSDSISRENWLFCDLNRRENIHKLLEKVSPAIIYHLASFVSVKNSWDKVSSVLERNVVGTSNLLDAVRTVCPEASVLVVGSNEVYGHVRMEMLPIRESYECNPSNPYGLSKWFQERLASFYKEKFDLKIYLCRTFHYTGPNQPEGFVCSDIARRVASVEFGVRMKIRVGNLEARRDFLDIRDVVEAYRLILENGRPGVPYNVCSGISYSIRQILDLLISISSKPVNYEVDLALYRPSDVPEYRGDPSLLKLDTGWTQKFRLEETLEDLMKNARINIRDSNAAKERENG